MKIARADSRHAHTFSVRFPRSHVPAKPVSQGSKRRLRLLMRECDLSFRAGHDPGQGIDLVISFTPKF
ncbi:hypothetical protein TPA0910_73110 [Streptomyces hygroscopicus subsp. sporocinereus]|uniref:Uncharacterized protein n=1 Tax=Streptomyces hygroscopicus TaxID=1912 RepID=A0ABQ3UBC3_STRHY|nr:hypothetical protein TPA0910_73110 [Streptomyces hygroscopicus]